MALSIEDIDQAVELFAQLVRGEAELSAELASSAADFFQGPAPGGTPHEALLGARRHLEWFLSERHSPSLLGAPAERLVGRWREEAEPHLQGAEDAVLDSFAGVYEVGEVQPGAGAWLRDVAGFGSFALADPGGSAALRPKDLIVGRLYPIGDGLHRASRAAAVFRDENLVAALEQDLVRAREETGRNLLHLSQSELERMFFRPGSGAPSPAGTVQEDADPRPGVLAVLVDGGLPPARAEELLRRLATAPRPPAQIIPGAGDALGEVLDELAFDTDVDLESARRALTGWWLHCSAPATATGAPAEAERKAAGGTSAARRAAVEAFERGRAAGGDLEGLFADLERDLGLGDGVERDGDAAGAALEEGQTGDDALIPDFPGVVRALVDEFVWEVETTEGRGAAARLGCLEHLGDFGADIGVAEGLDAQALLRFTTFWVHEKERIRGAEEARNLLDALTRFCSWAEDAHDLPLGREFGPTLATLKESLPRVAELNRVLAPPPDDAPGELFEVIDDGAGRFGGLSDRSGERREAVVESGLTGRLRPGDRLRARISVVGELVVYRCYPPEVARLGAR